MYFEGIPLKKIGTIPVSTLEKIEAQVTQLASDCWQSRSLKIFRGLSTLKLITPTNIDRTDIQTEVSMRKLIEPMLSEFLLPNERIVYLDISLIPPKTKTEVHFDFAWIHVLSRRIIIPLKANSASILSVLDEANKVMCFNLKLGEVYEFNNQLLHAAGNFGTENRMNIIVDAIDAQAYEYLRSAGKLDKTYCGKLNVFYIDKSVAKKIDSAMLEASAKTV